MSEVKIKWAAGWALFALWAAVLSVLSSLPGGRFGPLPFAGADKVVHMLLFSMGAFPLAIALFEARKRSILTTAIVAWLLMLAVGVADEFHQHFTPGRSGNDLGDLMADAFGAAFAITCVALFYGMRSPKRDLPPSGADQAA